MRTLWLAFIIAMLMLWILLIPQLEKVIEICGNFYPQMGTLKCILGDY